ncbi:DUF6318 family protein [Nocardioides pantholopis]|uniref:DUF6318 family protein n=1 Tax=Nocardioides pantholopis TaxID=2483798 RepID=UPI000F0898E4|nr:DUF6318 family protein [Nocardioides pantholopis]
MTRTPGPLRLLLAAACAALALTGCSEDDPAPKIDPGDSSSAAATPTPTSTAPVEPTLPAEAEGTDAAAAKAFVEFYWEMADYAQATGDAQGLQRLGADTCEPCRTAVAFVEEAYRDEGQVRGGETTLSAINSAELQTRTGTATQVKLKVTSTDQVVDYPGNRPDDRYPGGTVRASFVVTRDSGQWLVSYWEVS